MSPGRSGLDWLAGLAAVLSLVACYGTLAVIAVLGAIGIAVTLDEALWAGVIVALAALAVAGLGFGLVRHRRRWPLLIGVLGAVAIAYAMYVHYDRSIELSGFGMLGLAAFRDWRLRRVTAPGRSS